MLDCVLINHEFCFLSFLDGNELSYRLRFKSGNRLIPQEEWFSCLWILPELRSVVLQLHVRHEYTSTLQQWELFTCLKVCKRTYLLFSNIYLKPHLSQLLPKETRDCIFMLWVGTPSAMTMAVGGKCYILGSLLT